ncbi:MAG TPA: hypothetical protein VGP47_01140, partial [Parachlamydiaceae bacterium]|nr:hypothetical protein [Parachlamydiaceae bacterium]
MNEIKSIHANDSLIVYHSDNVLTDNHEDRYSLLTCFRDNAYQLELASPNSNYNNSSIREIESISSNLENLIDKSDGAMTLILKKTSISEAHQYIDDFLKLEDSEKEIFLNEYKRKLTVAIHSSDLHRIVGEATGDKLFHKLLRSKSAQVRSLALECNSAGFPIDAPNQKGSTGLVFAVLGKDACLTKELLARGANPDYQCGRWTPKEMAQNNSNTHFVNLEFFSHEVRLLKGDVVQICDLWKRIAQFQHEHSDGRHELNKNSNTIFKICDELVFLVAKALISAVGDDFDYNEIFCGSKNRWLRDGLIKYCAYEGLGSILETYLNSLDLRDYLSDFLKEAVSRDFSEEKDFKLLSYLFDSQLFFVLIDKETGESYINILLENPKVEPFFKSASLDEEMILNCAYLNQMIDPKMSLVSFFEEQQKIELTIPRLYQKNPSLAAVFNRFLESELNLVKRHKEAFSHYHEDNLQFFDFINKNNLDLPYLQDYAIYMENWELFTEIYDKKIFDGSIEKFQGKMFFHLFLDKFMVPQDSDLEGFSMHCTSGGLIRAFNALEKSLSDEHTQVNLFKKVKTEIVPLLLNVAEFC